MAGVPQRLDPVWHPPTERGVPPRLDPRWAPSMPGLSSVSCAQKADGVQSWWTWGFAQVTSTLQT